MKFSWLPHICLAIVLGSVAATAQDWPQFRGPSGDGQGSKSGSCPIHWSETSNVVWKTEIPHRGWSTPVIGNGRVWLTTATVEGNDYFVYCLDSKTGKVLLNEKLFHVEKPEPLGNAVNGYATPSATLDSGKVYVHFGTYGTACLDAKTFRKIWQRNDMPCRHYRGSSSSPVVYRDLVILTFDGADLQYHIALNKDSGETMWKTNRSAPWNDENGTSQMEKEGDRRKAHSTPLLVAINGRDVLLSAAAKAAYAYDPATGHELWQVRHDAWSAAPAPLYANGLAFFITGFGKTELIAVRTDGAGNVTDSHVAWRLGTMAARTASPILVGGNIYMINDEGMITCLEAATGKQIWRSRIPGAYASSPIQAGGNLYFSNQQGVTTVIRPGPSLDIVATNSLDIGTMASPAVAEGSLFLRTKTHLYRIGSIPKD